MTSPAVTSTGRMTSTMRSTSDGSSPANSGTARTNCFTSDGVGIDADPTAAADSELTPGQGVQGRSSLQRTPGERRDHDGTTAGPGTIRAGNDPGGNLTTCWDGSRPDPRLVR